MMDANTGVNGSGIRRPNLDFRYDLGGLAIVLNIMVFRVCSVSVIEVCV